LELEEDKKAPVKLSVYVDRETRTRLKIFCAKQEISMNQAINQMLDEWLHKQDESNKQDPITSSSAKGRGKKVKDGQFLRIEEFVEPQYPQSSTHSREGDWVVTRIERYPSGNADCSKREIVLCYCKFEPVLSALEPMGRGEPVAEMLEPVNA